MAKNKQNFQSIRKQLSNIVLAYEAEMHLSSAELLRKINAPYGKEVFLKSQLSKIESESIIPRAYSFFLLCEGMEMHSSKFFSITGKQATYHKKNCLTSREECEESLNKHFNLIIDQKKKDSTNETPKSSKDKQLFPWNDGWIANQMDEKLQLLQGKKLLQEKDLSPVAPYTILRYRKCTRNISLEHLIAFCMVANVELSDLIN